MDRYCDSKLSALASKTWFSLEVKQLWCYRVVLDQCTWRILHTNKLVCDDNAKVEHLLISPAQFPERN